MSAEKKEPKHIQYMFKSDTQQGISTIREYNSGIMMLLSPKLKKIPKLIIWNAIQMKNVGLKKKYQIGCLVSTFIFFVFSLMFTHVNRRQMCLFYTEFRNSQNK